MGPGRCRNEDRRKAKADRAADPRLRRAWLPARHPAELHADLRGRAARGEEEMISFAGTRCVKLIALGLVGLALAACGGNVAAQSATAGAQAVTEGMSANNRTPALD